MHTTQVLRDIPLFRGLSEESLQRLEANTTVRSIEEGEVYLTAGQPPRGFQVVLSGLLKMYRINRAGKEQIFGYARPNDVFGIVFISDPYRMMPTNCVARMSSEVIEVDLATMREV
ncbi:MAG: Crp/Fnr family transcriptional regulator, partial [Planctomycetota bacterium]